jgi:nitroreductase
MPLTGMALMDVLQLIRKRCSVRHYRDKPVEQDKLARLIEAVRLAPSACNSQPWKLILVNDPELKNQVAEATFSRMVSFNRFALEAPVIAVLVVEKPPLSEQMGALIKQRDFPVIDIGIAAAHFCLQATELGLGTCMLGWFDERVVKRLLHIPRKNRIGLLITLGYPAKDADQKEKRRKPVEEMSRFNDCRTRTIEPAQGEP